MTRATLMALGGVVLLAWGGVILAAPLVVQALRELGNLLP